MGEKLGKRFPFQIIESVEEETQLIIRLMVMGGTQNHQDTHAGNSNQHYHRPSQDQFYKQRRPFFSWICTSRV